MRSCPTCGAVTDDRQETCAEEGSPLEQIFAGPPILDAKYLIERSLGHGGMGWVGLAEHLVLKRQVAIKLVLPTSRQDDSSIARFRREAEALGRLDHPNIVSVIDYGVDGRGIPYLVMEHLEGRTLRDVVKDDGPLALERALAIFEQIADALDFAHERGVLHRDLKPANVVIIGEAAEERAKIVDLGLARLGDFPDPEYDVRSEQVESARPSEREGVATGHVGTSIGAVLGTPGYMAPELLRGGLASKASDHFAFGVLIYEAVSGRRLYPGTGKAARCDRRMLPPRLSTVIPALPWQLDDGLLAALARNPDDRPPSARQTVALIRRAWRETRVAAWKQAERTRRTMLPVLATLAAWFIVSFTGIQPFENRWVDTLFGLSEPQPPEPRILLVSIDDSTLAARPEALVAMAGEVGETLAAAFDAGASLVGIDILLPESWGEDERFLELLLEHHDRLVLAAFAGDDGALIGPEVVEGLATVALGAEATGNLFGFANVEIDADGVCRRMHTGFTNDQGAIWPSISARLAERAGYAEPLSPSARLIDFRIDTTAIERMPWQDLSVRIRSRPELLRDRILLIGTEFTGAGDLFQLVPTRSRSMSGLTLQAVMLDSLLGRNRLREIERWSILVITAFFGIALSMALLWMRKAWLAYELACSGALIVLSVSWICFRWFHVYVPATSAISILGMVVIASGVARAAWPAKPDEA